MEINAPSAYKGGETMRFRGTTTPGSTWTTVSIADQGGIHYAISGRPRLDTLPFLQGPPGRTLDLDIYFCSRQPGTAVFAMETDVELKPLPVKNIRIVDTVGAPITGKEILIGKTRLCARPEFQVPGEEAAAITVLRPT